MLRKYDWKRLLMLVLIIVLAVSSIFTATFAAAGGYVSPWAKTIVLKAQTYGILPITFKDQNMADVISRADFARVTVLLYEKSSGKTAELPSANPFDDTDDQDVLKAYSLGIVRGMGAGIFAPEASLTREQAAVMLTRAYMGITGSRLTATGTKAFNDDGKISAYAKPSVYFMVYKEFILGTGENYFSPKKPATREQTIAMAVRMIEAIKDMPIPEPSPEYSPGIGASTLEEAIAIIKSGQNDLAPEITMTIDENIYEKLLGDPFINETGIKSLYYVYNANTKTLVVKIAYSRYAQIMALTINPGLANFYATDEAKDLNTQINGILSNILTADMNIYDKEKAVHDYIVSHYKFDTSLTRYDLEHPSLSVAGLLYNQTGTCKAYAEMFNIMMTKLGIGAKMVYGSAGGNEHIWNMVRLSGNWYMVDVTWDDPVPDRGSEISYSYFNRTDEIMSKDHNWDQSKYPSCISVEYSFENMR